jgi:hypothetical protein
MDLNSQGDSPLTLEIQTKWQLEMMAKFGHNNVLLINTTFGTSQTRVRHTFMSFYILHCHSLFFTCDPICNGVLTLVTLGFALY